MVLTHLHSSSVGLRNVLGGSRLLLGVRDRVPSASSFRSSSLGCCGTVSSMRIVLPDSSELELPEGATGLDAAAAIGPKLAEQAVLVRSNGRVQDLRAPLEDGQPIQILTTRDTTTPTRSPSSATRLRTCSRRRFGGSTPESRSRSGRRLRTVSTTTSSSPSRLERTPSSGSRRRSARARRRARGRGRTSHATRRAGASRRRASPTRSSSSTRRRATSRSTRRASSPTCAAARTSRTRSRSRRSS